MSVLTTQDSYIKKFNTNLIQLIEQLHQQDPSKNIGELVNIIHTGVKVNAKLPSQLFLKYCEKQIEPIMKVDFEYLKSFDVGTLGNTETLQIVRKIVEVWTQTQSENVKELITKYMHLLLTYSIIINQRHDLVEIINKYRNKPLVMPD